MTKFKTAGEGCKSLVAEDYRRMRVLYVLPLPLFILCADRNLVGILYILLSEMLTHFSI